jgi:lipooligosaccharide transport system ATP-binding protein
MLILVISTGTGKGMAISAPIIEAREIRKRYGSLTAVDGISFLVERGECFGILGPNGAGKTTTVQMVYGLSPLSGGTITVFGLDTAREMREIKARLGVCHQVNNLDPDLTIVQNLEVFARYFSIPRPRAREKARNLLAFIALDHRRDSRVNELSGGLMRRLMLARALINDPELIILDEPTTGLDPQSRHQVWERLEELKSRGLTILLTTHYMEEASRLSDKIVIMDHGRILVNGRPRDLVREHAGANVIEIPYPTDELRTFVLSKDLAHEDLGHRLIIYTSDGESLYHEIISRFCTEECLLRMATLEDVFLKLTGRELRE